MNPKTSRILSAVVGALLAVVAAGATRNAWAASPKFYFRVGPVKAGPEVDAALKAYAGQALKEDLASRPEWASDVGTTETEALVAERPKKKSSSAGGGHGGGGGGMGGMGGGDEDF